jgi:hypothetical protein
MATDAPDYLHVITISYGGTVTDAPDWTDQVTGAGGGPVPGVTSATDWAPSDFGIVGWSNPPWQMTTSSPLDNWTTAFLFMWPVKFGATTNVSTIGISVKAQGVTFTANECFIGLYSASFTGNIPNTYTRVATSVAGVLEANLTANQGFVPTALSSSLAVTAGSVLYAAILLNFTAGTPEYYAAGGYYDTIANNSTVYKSIVSPFWSGPYTTLPASVTYASSFAQTSGFPFTGVY